MGGGGQGIILLARGPHRHLFPDVFLVPALLWLLFPNTTSNRIDATEDIRSVVQQRERETGREQSNVEDIKGEESGEAMWTECWRSQFDF